MTYLFDKAFQVVLMILFLFIFVVLLAVGIFLMGYMKKKGKKEEDEYYQILNGYDAKDYLDFDDIFD